LTVCAPIPRPSCAANATNALDVLFRSVQIARGVPITNVAAQVGHARSSITRDVYGHVLLAEEAC
jgi:hypothetical protein